MKVFKSFINMFLVLALLLGCAHPAFAAYNNTYGFWVPITNSNVLWVGNNGTTNQQQIRSMSSYLEYSSSNGVKAYYNNIIFVNPGNVSLAMSVAKKIGQVSFDTTISDANNWTYKTLSGSCSAKTSSYKYNGSLTWHKLNISGMKLGDLVQINSSKINGYIFCGSPSDAYMTLSDVDGNNINGKTYEIKSPYTNVKLSNEIGFGNTPYDSSEVQKIKWSSSNSAVATVKDGNVSFTGKEGNVKIQSSYTFYMAEGLSLTTLSRSVTFNVKQDKVDVESINILPDTATIKAADEIQLTTTILPSNATYQDVTWSSSDASVASVDQTGKVKGISAGTATIKATASNGISAQSVIQVDKVDVESINILPDTATIKTADEIQLTTTILPSNATYHDVTWSSSDPSVASVDQTGKMKGISAGTAFIKATASNGIFAQSVIHVVSDLKINVAAISLDTSSLSLNEGNIYQLIATITPNDATNTTTFWRSSNESVATVDSNGEVTAVAPGYAAIVAITEDGYYTSFCNIIVGNNPAQ